MPYFTALVGSPQYGSGFGGPYAIDHILVISAQISTSQMNHLERNMVKMSVGVKKADQRTWRRERARQRVAFWWGCPDCCKAEDRTIRIDQSVV